MTSSSNRRALSIASVGAAQLARSAALASIEICLDKTAFVAVCQHCRARMDHLQAMQPRCCRAPEVGYRDTEQSIDAISRRRRRPD